MRQKVILPYKLNLEICELLDVWRYAVRNNETYLSFGEYTARCHNAVCMDHWLRAVNDWSAFDTCDREMPAIYSEWLNNIAEDSFC